jgi:demethylmacrocin O-methyltransferase
MPTHKPLSRPLPPAAALVRGDVPSLAEARYRDAQEEICAMQQTLHKFENTPTLSGKLDYLKYRLSRFSHHISYLTKRVRYSNSLPSLASAMGTDKEGTHYYTKHYAFHFSSLRHRRLKILEIGVERGASLKTWKAYFPNSMIYGIDILDKSIYNARRIKTFQGSQADNEFLGNVIQTIGAPDIIIDDGSHINEHVIQTFQTLFPLLAPNGIYVIEDLQTSYWSLGSTDCRTDWGGSMNPSAPTSMNFLKSLIDGINYEEFPPGKNYLPTYFDKHIVGLHFYHSLAFIYKGNNNEGSSAFGKRY